MRCLLTDGTWKRIRKINQFNKYQDEIIEIDISYGNVSSLDIIPFGKFILRINCNKQQHGLISLKGLEECENLQCLECNYNHITSLEHIKCLKELRYLECGHNLITSLQPLKHLTKLETLNVSHNMLISLEGLPVSIKELYCHNNLLINLHCLRTCVNLVLLDCYNNRLTSINGVEDCIELTQLDCVNNEIVSLEPLTRCIKLKSLLCGANKINSLHGLRNCVSLEELSISQNMLKYIDIIGHLQNIRYLYVNDNPITDISIVRNFPLLTRIECYKNNFHSIIDIIKETSIKYLVIDIDKLSLAEQYVLKRHEYEISIDNYMYPDSNIYIFDLTEENTGKIFITLDCTDLNIHEDRLEPFVQQLLENNYDNFIKCNYFLNNKDEIVKKYCLTEFIIDDNDHTKNIDIECPICYDTTFTRYVKCINDHIICKSCYDNIDKDKQNKCCVCYCNYNIYTMYWSKT